MNKKNKYILALLAVVILAGAAAYVILLLQNAEDKSNITMKNKLETIKLPEPRYESETSVEEALLARRSVRDYKSESLTLEEVSQILWAAQGITDKKGSRTAPSAGALYPLEVYAVVGNVDDFSEGVYKYKPQCHELVKVAEGDKRMELYNAALNQSAVKNAAVAVVFSAVYERTTEKYGERGERYVHLETGHAAQNVYLQAAVLDLGTVVIGAFDDSEVKKIMNMQDDEQPLYIMPVGRKK
ncbi:SagB/ThcOx family dehydrogenase [Candidatus Parcubacteria bacterium]|nr:SagB/ThcOx family dehydrogenase [Candidatus Parcubacteria bacterium]